MNISNTKRNVQTSNNQTAMQDAIADFESTYARYAATSKLDDLHTTDYARLDETGQIYLDYTGGGLYAESQLRDHVAMLSQNVFGNPHSNNPTSSAMTARVERTRAAVFTYFNADPKEYVVIFTANASGALKLVGEAFPFEADSRYMLTYDNHNSVNGIREFARAKGARVTYVPIIPPDMRIDESMLADQLDQANPKRANLLAFPAQSNFTGVQHSLDWVARAQSLGWHVLVDCAAFAPTNRLDIDAIQPDFVPLSFYKMFGYPTGLGCLIARKSAVAKLRRPWFAGGTITIASVQGEGWHYLVDGEAGFEDGTVDYLNIPAVETGLQHLTNIGIDVIHERVTCLTGWLLEQMAALRHSSGVPLVKIYGPTSLKQRGGTIAFNMLDAQGKSFDFRRVETLASEANISLRTGCFCNPGAGEIAHNVTKEEMAQCFINNTPMSFDEFYDFIQSQGDKNASTIRISVGLVTNFADVYQFIQFAQTFLNKTAAEIGIGSTDGRSVRDTA